MTAPVSQHMLHPHGRSNFTRASRPFVQITNAHWEIQRESPDEATKTTSTSGLVAAAWITIHQPLRSPNSLLFVVNAIGIFLDATTILVATSPTIVIARYMQFVQQIIIQNNSRNRFASVQECHISAQPIEQRIEFDLALSHEHLLIFSILFHINADTMK